jgi:hypothetical protein
VTAPLVAVKERPILFSGPMVKAILEGRKSQTRRIVKPMRGWEEKYPICKPDMMHYGWQIWWHGDITDRVGVSQDCPYGKPGDRLWVRETLRRPDGDPWLYDADKQPVMVSRENETAMLTWAHHKNQDHCVSIHMPRWASRITLEITDVRVERLQEVSGNDAKAEGVRGFNEDGCWVYEDYIGGRGTWCMSAKASFLTLWESINGHESLANNEWVWVVSFKRIEQGGGRS